MKVISASPWKANIDCPLCLAKLEIVTTDLHRSDSLVRANSFTVTCGCCHREIRVSSDIIPVQLLTREEDIEWARSMMCRSFAPEV